MGGNQSIDPRCQEIYAKYDKCYKEWKQKTDWRQWYHEGESEQCQPIFNDFNFCVKEQLTAMAGEEPPKEMKAVRKRVLKEGGGKGTLETSTLEKMTVSPLTSSGTKNKQDTGES